MKRSRRGFLGAVLALAIAPAVAPKVASAEPKGWTINQAATDEMFVVHDPTTSRFLFDVEGTRSFGESVWIRHEGVAQPSGSIVMEQGESLHWDYDVIRLGPSPSKVECGLTARCTRLSSQHAMTAGSLPGSIRAAPPSSVN